MIVDDEALIREGIMDILSIMSLDFYQAENGKVALELLQNNTIDIIITDLNMPIMNGVEFLRRKSQLGNKAPTIVITSHGDRTIEHIIKGLGVTYLIEKPFNEQEIISAVKTALN